jgi:hypothetical protein
MNNEDRKLLEDDGWEIECESPFEISDMDGNSASGRAANYVLDCLKYMAEDDVDGELEVISNTLDF